MANLDLAGIITRTCSDLQAKFAALAHTHAAADITSGTLDSARLPVATTSAVGGVKVDGTTVTISNGVISATGGGGSGLPTVTTADNGKVLRVVNGEWAAVALPSASGVSF